MADPTSEAFAGKLVRLRKAKLLSREALAKESGVGYGTIRDLERGVARAPHMSTITKLAAALGLDGEERADFESAALSKTPSPPDQDRDETAVTDTEAVAAMEVTAADTIAASLLPHDIGSFTGRQDELRRLVACARHAAEAGTVAAHGVSGIFVIEGMGGVGKTTLAVRAAHIAAGDYPDGQLFLDLQGYTPDLPALTSHQALRSVLRALGVPNELIPSGRAEREAFYRNTVAGKRLLIICDNASSAAQVRPLIPGTDGSIVIVTSRTSLRSLDDARVLTLRTPPEDEAVALFRAVADGEYGEHGEHGRAGEGIAEIVRLCGCLPLAVRIIAARLSRRPALQLSDVLAELRHEHDLLASLQDEERSVTAVFHSSLRSLPDSSERQLFQRLSLIPGPDFDTFAAASLTGAGYRETRRLLESLLDHNLLIQHVPGRYRFHDLVRVYARTSQVPGTAQAAGSLLNYYLYTARLADLVFERGLPRPDPPVTRPAIRRPAAVPELDTSVHAQAWLAAELANLSAAAHSATRRNRPDVTIGLSAALADYLRAHGPWPRALSLHVAALKAATQARDAHGQAAAMRAIGGIQSRTGEIREAKTMLGQAVEIYRRLGDSRGQGRALIELGIAQRVAGDAECLETFTRALSIYENLGDRHGRAAALNELGSVRWQIGPVSMAEDHLLEALAIYRELGNRHGQAAALLYLGNVRRAVGLLDDAEKSLNSALKSYTELSHRQGMATALAYLGKTLLLSGSYDRAGDSLGQALALFGELGDRSGKAETLNAYAAVARASGQPDVARMRYSEGLRFAGEVSSGRDKADALAGLADLRAADGDTAGAVAGYRDALALYEAMQASADAARVQEILTQLRAHPEPDGLAWLAMRFADSPSQGDPVRDNDPVRDDTAGGDVPLSRPAVDPAVPRAARALLCAKNAPLTPACHPRPPRRRRAFLPQQPERRLVTVEHAVTGLTAAMAIAVTGSAPWAFGVLIFATPVGWQSATSHYALLLSELIVAVTMIVFASRVALAGDASSGRAARDYHGRYLTGEDLDATGRVLLHRAQEAADTVRSAAVSKAGLLDEVAVDAALAAQEWDIALTLREQARLRARRAAAGDPVPGSAAAELLGQQHEAARASQESVTRRVVALERYAAEVRAADTAYRQRLTRAAIADLSAPHLDLLARTAADDYGIAELDAMTRQAAALRRSLK